MPSTADMRLIVDTYLQLVGSGTAEQIADLYAENATLEDPVGTEPKTGREAILAFYKVIEPIERSTELVSFKAGGDTAVFEFRIVTVFGDTTIELSPVDIMLFDDNAKVTSMRAVWSPEDMVRRTTS